jgi:hypothetical protein
MTRFLLAGLLAALGSALVHADTNDASATPSTAAPTVDPNPPAVTPPPLIKIDADSIKTQLYVSPSGDDTWTGLAPSPKPGTADGPFRTLGRAHDELKRLKAAGLPAGGVVINLRGGEYSLSDSYALTADDSGTAAAPIVYRSYKDEVARIDGAHPVKASDFKPVTDPAVLARLAPAAKGKVLQLDLNALNIQHSGPFPDKFDDNGGLFELFVDGKRMPLSRWPADGPTTMSRVIANGDAHTGGVFEYREDEPARWPANGGFWLKGQWRVGWEEPALKVASIDTAQKQITFAIGLAAGIGNKYAPVVNGVRAGNGKEAYYAINLLEEITKPGQWAVDFNTKTLYFYPPGDLNQEQVVVTQLDKPLVALDHTTNTAFIGLTFEYSLGDGVVVTGGTDDLIAGCTLRYLAGTAVSLDGMHNGIQSCDMYGIGQGCIMLTGGDRLQLVPSNSYVINNHLHDYGVLKSQYSPGVDVAWSHDAKVAGTAVGMYIAHNLLHHAPRDAFIIGGDDNVFEYNEVFDCGFGSADTGAFYSWHDWTIRGIIIRYNYLHDTVGGVNPDDAASGSISFGNVLVGPRIGFWVASGPDHHFINNILVKNVDVVKPGDGAVFGLDDRGISRKYATDQKMILRMKEVNPDSPPWSTKYPEIVGMLNNRPELPWRTIFARNVVVTKDSTYVLNKLSKDVAAMPGMLTIDGNFATADDPGFVNAAKGNYALKPDSAVFKQIPGFAPIPFDQIGLQVDQYRTKLPTPEEAGRTESTTPQTESKNFGT